MSSNERNEYETRRRKAGVVGSGAIDDSTGWYENLSENLVEESLLASRHSRWVQSE